MSRKSTKRRAHEQWSIRVDTGGTFTDCLARDPSGEMHRSKVLSSSALLGVVRAYDADTRTLRYEASWNDTPDLLRGCRVEQPEGEGVLGVVVKSRDGVAQLAAGSVEATGDWQPRAGETIRFQSEEESPILAARLVTSTAGGASLPAMDFRLATTRATNALLERNGAEVALFVNAGLGDLLLIGDQTRPSLFALQIVRPASLYERVIEVRGRLDAAGNEVEPIDIPALERDADRLVRDGVRVAAVALMHSYRDGSHEELVARVLRSRGFTTVSVSSELAPLIRIVPRARTTVVDAYVGPIMRSYLDRVSSGIDRCAMHVMSSAGGLSRSDSIRAKDCLLSGPAGGVVAARAIGKACGETKVISFDMGGTSTDVCRIEDDYVYRFEHRVGDAEIMAPAFAIETVASGGGSICAYEHGQLKVGPRSAGASPGPACYGGGGPLTLTDVNLLAGRLDASRFGIPLDPEASHRALAALRDSILSVEGSAPEADALIEGLLSLADDRMADAISRVSLRQGVDPASYALVSFGGAGGQHACRIASRLGIEKVIMPRDASILSALGLDCASIERFSERQVLALFEEMADTLPDLISELAEEVMQALRDELSEERVDDRSTHTDGLDDGNDAIARRVFINARLPGQNASVQVETEAVEALPARFREQYELLYGHAPERDAIEIESVRVVVSSAAGGLPASTAPSGMRAASPSGSRAIVTSTGRVEAGLFERADCSPGDVITGPAVVHDETSTFLIEPGCRCEVDGSGALVVTHERHETTSRNVRDLHAGDETIQRDLFINRLTSIAGEMGDLLERIARSTNVKERRDFSCAILDAKGRLLVSAPHIPVHLGALGPCIRAVAEVLGPFEPGDVVVTNHPAFGGSHLPDLTVITPVFDSAGKRLLAYAANRAHHAELGGRRPGSMPPGATSLVEEGVVISPMFLVRGGQARFDDVRAQLSGAQWPSRDVEENLADLRASIASNRHGVQAITSHIASMGVDAFLSLTEKVFRHASGLAQRALEGLSTDIRRAQDAFDDGAVIAVSIARSGDRLVVDFEGTSDVHPGNLNATPAIVHSAVMYVLRVLLGESCPLNDGLMDHVSVRLPKCMLNPSFADDPSACPAVVGGNVETSQKIVDVLLKAMDRCAASQGTMNNLLLGNDRFGYYETICGGSGAGPDFDGCDAVHTHMTNTRLTDPEVLEHRYPLRLLRFGVRRGSGGQGAHRGGDGVVREIAFLQDLQLSILSQRRISGPFGMHGGESGACGEQFLVRDGSEIRLAGVDSAEVRAGDRLVIRTPGGGGWGATRSA